MSYKIAYYNIQQQLHHNTLYSRSSKKICQYKMYHYTVCTFIKSVKAKKKKKEKKEMKLIEYNVTGITW